MSRGAADRNVCATFTEAVRYNSSRFESNARVGEIHFGNPVKILIWREINR